MPNPAMPDDLREQIARQLDRALRGTKRELRPRARSVAVLAGYGDEDESGEVHWSVFGSHPDLEAMARALSAMMVANMDADVEASICPCCTARIARAHAALAALTPGADQPHGAVH